MNRRVWIRYYAEHPVAWLRLCRRALHGPGAWPVTWFHADWAEAMADCMGREPYLLLAPRGYTKSSVMVAEAVRRVLLVPAETGEQYQVLMAADNDAKAREFANEYEYLLRSELVQKLMGGYEVERRGNAVHIPAPPAVPHRRMTPTPPPTSPTISVYTVLSGRTGVHIDYGALILDDAYVSATSVSAVEQERRYHAIHGGWKALAGPLTDTLVSGTRYTPMDYYQTMLDAGVRTNEGSRSAICEDGTALWPERWPLEALAELRKASNLGEVDFQLQYQNNVQAAAGKVFPPALLDMIREDERPEEHYVKARCYGVDMNYGGADRTAVVEAFFAHNRTWLVPILCHSYDEGQEHLRTQEIVRLTDRWKTYVEANGPQKINVDILRRAGHRGIEPYLPRGSKEVRARELAAAMNSDEVRILEELQRPLTAELVSFTGREGDRDDLVDAAVMAWQGIQEWREKPGPRKINTEIRRPKGSFGGVFK